MSLDRAPPMSTPSPGRQWAASTQWSRPVYLVSHEKHVGTENAPNRSIFIRFELSFFLNWSEFNQRSIGTSAMLPACLVSKLRTNLCMGPICEICYIVWVQARLSQFIEEKSPKNYKLSEWAQILWGSSPVSQTKVRQVCCGTGSRDVWLTVSLDRPVPFFLTLAGSPVWSPRCNGLSS